MRRLRMLLALYLLSLTCLALACESAHDFEGVWRGPISADPHLQQGFGPSAQLTLTVIRADSDPDISAQVPGHDQPLRFEPIRRASADALGAMSLPGDSLRSYVGYLRPVEQEPYLMVVTLYSQSRIEARVIRGPDEAYGVFRLAKP